MAHIWDAADDDLEKLLYFDDFEVPTVAKSCKSLPTIGTTEAGTKSTSGPGPFNSSDPHATVTIQIVHPSTTHGLCSESDLDAGEPSANAAVPGTLVLASRVDKFSAGKDILRFTTSQLDAQLVVSRRDGLHGEAVKERRGTVTGEEGCGDEQRIQSGSGRGKPDVIPTQDGHRKEYSNLSAINSADIEAHVGIVDGTPELRDETASVKVAYHASQVRISSQSTSSRGRQNRSSSVERRVELNASDQSSDESIDQTRQTIAHAQTQGAARVRSQLRHTGIIAPLEKRRHFTENVGTAVENTHVLSRREVPLQCNPPRRGCGAHEKRNIQHERTSPERRSDGGLPYRIPGPAGALQENFRKRTPNGALKSCRRSFESGSQDDTTDFAGCPWITAMDYLNAVAPKHLPRVKIATIKSLSRHLEHIPELVAVIKTAVPNGLGDVSVVLKDPTGTIDGRIHRSVLTESKYGHGVVPRAVLILRKVTVFIPNPYAHYLNITTENVHKVFGSQAGSSRPQTRVCVDNTNSVEGNKMKALGAFPDYPKELSPGLAGITQRIQEPTGVRNSVQHTKRQAVKQSDASHGSADVENQISVQKPRRGESAKNPLHDTRATRFEDTEDIHSPVTDINLEVRDFTRNPLQGQLPNMANTHDAHDRATQEAVVDAKSKAAGWDFGEDVELLLNDDFGSFLL